MKAELPWFDDMKNCKRALIAFLPFVIVFVFASCNVKESNNNFKGGELIDEGLLSEIRSELEISETLTEDADENTSDIEDDGTVSSIESSTNGYTETNTATDITTENVSDGITVYWSESGSVWHLHEDCGHLKNSKNIFSGSEEEASEAGKERLCSSCEKKNDK